MDQDCEIPDEVEDYDDDDGLYDLGPEFGPDFADQVAGRWWAERLSAGEPS